MPTKTFQDNVLQEIHNTSIDYHTNSPKIQLYSQTGEDVQLTVKSDTPKKSKLKDLGNYAWMECIQALCVEFVVCIINQLFSHMAPSTLGYWAGHIMLILIIYPVSGANMNAVMSLALWIYEEEFNLIHTVRRWSYILIIQPLGIFVGQMLCLVFVVDDQELKYISNKDTKPVRIMFTEFIGTFFTIYSALHFIVSKYTRPSKELGLQFFFFGMAVYFCMDIGQGKSSASGGAYNITYYLISSAIAKHKGNSDVFDNWYCYVFPHILGALGATFLFKFYYEKTYYKIYMLKLKWEETFFPKKYN